MPNQATQLISQETLARTCGKQSTQRGGVVGQRRAAPGTAWGAISPERGGNGERCPPGAGGLARSLLQRSRPRVELRRLQLVLDGARRLAPTSCVWCAVCACRDMVREGQGVRLARLACCSARCVRRARRLGCRQCSVPSPASASLYWRATEAKVAEVEPSSLRWAGWQGTCAEDEWAACHALALVDVV